MTLPNQRGRRRATARVAFLLFLGRWVLSALSLFVVIPSTKRPVSGAFEDENLKLRGIDCRARTRTAVRSHQSRCSDGSAVLCSKLLYYCVLGTGDLFRCVTFDAHRQSFHFDTEDTGPAAPSSLSGVLPRRLMNVNMNVKYCIDGSSLAAIAARYLLD